uniref:Metallothionein n=1 Tax=Knipowitschia caucasica TaxID=637954 RepID=A0AAV2KS66_KNICA
MSSNNGPVVESARHGQQQPPGLAHVSSGLVPSASAVPVQCQCSDTSAVTPVQCQCSASASAVPVQSQCSASAVPVQCQCSASAVTPVQ